MLTKPKSYNESLLEDEREKKALSLLGIASEVVAAYVSNNTAPSEEISSLIIDVYRTLAGVVNGGRGASMFLQESPAVPIGESVTQDYLVCLEDGKRMKMLKRYLRSMYNMTPDQYRERWDLPSDYPMVAPNYAHKRSQLAKVHKLGQSGGGKKSGVNLYRAV